MVVVSVSVSQCWLVYTRVKSTFAWQFGSLYYTISLHWWQFTNIVVSSNNSSWQQYKNNIEELVLVPCLLLLCLLSKFVRCKSTKRFSKQAYSFKCCVSVFPLFFLFIFAQNLTWLILSCLDNTTFINLEMFMDIFIQQ